MTPEEEKAYNDAAQRAIQQNNENNIKRQQHERDMRWKEEESHRLPPGVVDRTAFNFGRDPNGATNLANKLQGNADAAQGRQGEHIDTTGADLQHNNALTDRAVAYGARQQQVGMADMMRNRASGATPSIAGMRANQDIGRAVADQTSIAAGARGPAALALANQQAAAGSAGAISNISNTAQINSAQERSDAEKSAFAAYSGLRGGDQQQQATDLHAQGQDFSQAQAQAGMNADQRKANDAYTLGSQAQSIGVTGMQLGADMNRDAAEQSGHFNAAGRQDEKNKENDANNMGYLGAAISGVSTAAQFAAASDERTKVPVTWGSGDAAPAAAGTSTWGTGSGLDMSKMLAHQALDSQAQRENAASTKDAFTKGPMAVDMDPGKRWDSEELGGIKAKERNEVDLSPSESNHKASLQARERTNGLQSAIDKVGEGAGKGPSKEWKTGQPEKKGLADKGAEALGGIGSAVSGLGANMHGSGWKPTTFNPAPLAMPKFTTSDADAKRAAFIDGVNHTQQLHDTGEASKPPAYMAGDEKTQDEMTGPRGKASSSGGKAGGHSYARKDPAQQNKTNRDSEDNYNRAHLASALAVPLGFGATLGADQADRNEDAFQQSRSAYSSQPAPAPALQSEPAPVNMATMTGPRGKAAATVGRAAGSVFGRPAPVSTQSDEKTKTRASQMLSSQVDEHAARMGDGAAVGSKKSTLDQRAKDLIASMSASNAAQLNAGPSIDASKPRGAIIAGNIKHEGRESIDNADGSKSTVRSMSFNDGPGREVLIPTAYDGAVHSEDDAIANYRKTGQHMGVFRTPDHATAHAEEVHDDYEAGKYKTGSERLTSRDKASLTSGPSARPHVGNLGPEMPHADMAAAARSMRGVPYAYKPEFAQQERQAPGEVNVGPVAQEMQHSPVAATAVKQGPDGMRSIDLPKFTKILGAISADHQEQLDEQDKKISFMARRLGARR